jgi:hypothetical protein
MEPNQHQTFQGKHRMTKAATGLRLAFSLDLLSAGPAFTQIPAIEAAPDAKAAAPAAYVLSHLAEELSVYTATPTSISEVSRSSYKVASPYGLNGLSVVPKL